MDKIRGIELDNGSIRLTYECHNSDRGSVTVETTSKDTRGRRKWDYICHWYVKERGSPEPHSSLPYWVICALTDTVMRFWGECAR